MRIKLNCRCGKQLEVNMGDAGRRGKCPACGGEFTIPTAPARPAAPAQWSGMPAVAPAAPTYNYATRSTGSGAKPLAIAVLVVSAVGVVVVGGIAVVSLWPKDGAGASADATGLKQAVVVNQSSSELETTLKTPSRTSISAADLFEEEKPFVVESKQGQSASDLFGSPYGSSYEAEQKAKNAEESGRYAGAANYYGDSYVDNNSGLKGGPRSPYGEGYKDSSNGPTPAEQAKQRGNPYGDNYRDQSSAMPPPSGSGGAYGSGYRGSGSQIPSSGYRPYGR